MNWISNPETQAQKSHSKRFGYLLKIIQAFLRMKIEISRAFLSENQLFKSEQLIAKSLENHQKGLFWNRIFMKLEKSF